MREFYRKLNCELANTTSYRPTSNSIIERVHRRITKGLKIYASRTNTWSKYLSAIIYQINTSEHSSTGYSPYFIQKLQHPRYVTSILAIDEEPPRSLKETVAEMLKSVTEVDSNVLENTQQGQIKRLILDRKQEMGRSFEIGDLVYVYIPQIRRGNQGQGKHLTAKWVKAIIKHKNINGLSYIVDYANSNTQLDASIHVDRLKRRYLGEDLTTTNYDKQRQTTNTTEII